MCAPHLCSWPVYQRQTEHSARLLFFSQTCIIISYRECFHSCFCPPPPFPLVYHWLLSWIVLITQLQSVFHSMQILYAYHYIFFLTMYQSSIEYKLALNSKTHYNIHYHVLDLIWKNYTSVQNTYISYKRQILCLFNHRYKFFMLHVFFLVCNLDPTCIWYQYFLTL